MKPSDWDAIAAFLDRPSFGTYHTTGVAEHMDRAVIARIGGNEYRSNLSTVIARGHGMNEADAVVAIAVRHVMNNRKASRAAYLPESAFDWPIYRAAAGFIDPKPGDDTYMVADLSLALRDLLDDAHHDNECIQRCLRNDCDADHHCDVCADDDDE